MSKSVTWKISKRDTFYETVKKLDKPTRQKLGEIINLLIYSEYPNRFGEKKITKYGEARSIYVNLTIRLTFDVGFSSRIITLIRVGSHKEVYGKG